LALGPDHHHHHQQQQQQLAAMSPCVFVYIQKNLDLHSKGIRVKLQTIGYCDIFLCGFPHYHQANDRTLPTNSPEPHSSNFVTTDHLPTSCFIFISQRKISVGNSTQSLLQTSHVSYPPFSRFVFVPFKCLQLLSFEVVW
jgi:hypothetical protein